MNAKSLGQRKLLLSVSFFLILFTAISSNNGIIINGTWNLTESEVSYNVNHPFKKAIGTSKKTKGKGRCNAQQCEFLLAVPVVSFDSGDSNRDLHMLEATKGATFPVITVRTKFKPSSLVQNQLKVDLDIEFAGIKAVIPNVSLQFTQKNKDSLQVSSSFILRLSQFSIVKPSLLGMAVDDEVPVKVMSTWVPGNEK